MSSPVSPTAGSVARVPTGSVQNATTPAPQNTTPGSPGPTPVAAAVAAATPASTSTPSSAPSKSTQSAMNAGSNSAAQPVRPGRGRRTSSTKHSFKRLRDTFSPSTHDLKEYDSAAQGTSRPYLHRQQRRRLLAKTLTEFAMTLILSITYWLILYLFHFNQVIDKKHRRIFNALVTGNALFLGINLSASLKSYVKMLRWNILAGRYRSLKMFDLILGCDSVMNVLKLVWHGRSNKRPFVINILTSATSMLAILWLVIQLGIAVCVGLIGLTYSLDVNPSWFTVQTGNTSIINLPSLSTGFWLSDLAATGLYAIKGDGVYGTPADTFSYEQSQGSYQYDGQGGATYYFVDSNAEDANIQAVSYRYIDVATTCQRSTVTKGQYGQADHITYNLPDGTSHNLTLYETPGEGGTYIVANTNSTCGDRCTQLNIFSAAVAPEDLDTFFIEFGAYIEEATYFTCDVQVTNVLYYGDSAGSEYDISPMISRMLAGMLGWSSNPMHDGKYLYQIYSVADELGFANQFGATPATAADVQTYISRIIAGAIEDMDGATGISRKYIADGRQPIQAQVLDVKWWAAYTLIFAIPLVQFLTWMAVVATANRVIIKDDTPLSMAKMYWTLLRDNLGEHGCMLDGDQLIDEVGTNMVVYGYKEVAGTTTMKHVDIFEEGRGCDPARSFPEGEYDGLGLKRRKVVREFDAGWYF